MGVDDALRMMNAGLDYLMGTWQAPLLDYRAIKPSC
jgi:hypothetical protein